MSKDVKTFVNPVNGPRYQGSFSVELTDGAKTDFVPRSARISGNIVTIQDGSINQGMGGIQFQSESMSFAWGYTFIKLIRKGDGELLWVNNNYR
jgi:hypothetical protein